ncbi:unnamed protein product, partial [Prorocentrum cordatum]
MAAGAGGVSPLPWQVARDGCGWLVVLGAYNLAIRAYVRRHPKGALSCRVAGGYFNQVVYQYFAAVVGQAVVLPLCWGFAWAGRDRGAPWWFGAQPQCAAGEYLAFSVAYFLSDALANWADTSGVLLLHHAAAVACALLASVAGCWLGLFVSLAMVYEVGSLSWSLSDLGLFPRHAALWTMLAIEGPEILALQCFHDGRFRPASGPGTLTDRSGSKPGAERWGQGLQA